MAGLQDFDKGQLINYLVELARSQGGGFDRSIARRMSKEQVIEHIELRGGGVEEAAGFVDEVTGLIGEGVQEDGQGLDPVATISEEDWTNLSERISTEQSVEVTNVEIQVQWQKVFMKQVNGSRTHLDFVDPFGRIWNLKQTGRGWELTGVQGLVTIFDELHGQKRLAYWSVAKHMAQRAKVNR